MENTKNNDQAAFQETIKNIEEILRYEGELRGIFGEMNIPVIRNSVESMKTHISSVINGYDPQISEEEKSLIEKVLNLFSEVAINKPIKPIFADLAFHYLLLANNWNSATVKSPQVSQKIELINGVMSGALSLRDAIRVLQELIQRAERLQSFEPPSFNLSRAYLEILKKDVEKKNEEKKEEKKDSGEKSQEKKRKK